MMRTLFLAPLLIALSINYAYCRDLDGKYAGSPNKAWFDSLKSGKGPCCSDADGTAISDVDWRSDHGHYSVRIKDIWYDVPEDAVLNEPNRDGRTIVWPMYSSGILIIRCFIPGQMG